MSDILEGKREGNHYGKERIGTERNVLVTERGKGRTIITPLTPQQAQRIRLARRTGQWQRKNLRSASTKLSQEDYARFVLWCAERDTTPYAALQEMIKASLGFYRPPTSLILEKGAAQ